MEWKLSAGISLSFTMAAIMLVGIVWPVLEPTGAAFADNVHVNAINNR
jgi:hypothetical protein